MPETERRSLLRRLTAYAQQVAAAQMLVADVLDVQSDEPLWNAQQTADVLNVSADTVRDRGAEWSIEADLGDGIHRYIPEAVRALRERRKEAARARLEGRARGKYRLPGMRKPKREPTNPRTDNEAEARRQLHARMGESATVRVQREVVEDLTVNDLLDLYVLDCEDKGQPIQTGRVEPWRHALGHARAVDVRRDHLDDLCRRWRRSGPTWTAGERALNDGHVLTWDARDASRVRPLGGASCNRLVAVLRRAYSLGKEKCGLLTALTFPHFKETARGEYITEDQCLAICEYYQAKRGAAVKADVFRLAYLPGVRKGQLRRTCKRHVIIRGDQWKLSWSAEDTKGGKKTGRPHEILLIDEPLAIVQRAWAHRRPDSDLLFHVHGEPLGSMLCELKRTCELLGIPYGRGKGIVFHDTRHSAVTNFVAASVPETVAMTISDHADATVFRRYNVRRDDVQADALAKQTDYLAQQRGTGRRPAPLPRVGNDAV